MTRPCRVLFLGNSDEDFKILRRYFRPAQHTEIKLVNMGRRHPEGHELEGLLVSVTELEGYKCDVVMASPYGVDGDEYEILLAQVLDPNPPA